MGLNPIKALVWSAIANGIVAPFVLLVLLLVVLGLATALMFGALVGLIAF